MASVKMRQMVEKAVVGRFVRDALKAGYRITVSLERGYDAPDCLLGSTDRKAIMAEAFAGDECHLFLHKAEGPLQDEDGRLDTVGWVYCVMGNDGYDVISDYTTNLDKLGLMAGAEQVSDRYS